MGDIPAWAADSDSDDGGGDDNAQWNNNGSGGGGGDIEMQKSKDDDNQYMSSFFSEVDRVNADIKAIAKASKEIDSINEQSMRSTTTAEEQKLSKKLGPLIGTTNKSAKRTKDVLGLLKQETDKLKDEGKLNASNVRYVLVLYYIFCSILALAPLCQFCNTVLPILHVYVFENERIYQFLIIFVSVIVVVFLLLLLLLLFQLIDKQCDENNNIFRFNKKI